jgi:hypothetical protein
MLPVSFGSAISMWLFSEASTTVRRAFSVELQAEFGEAGRIQTALDRFERSHL